MKATLTVMKQHFQSVLAQDELSHAYLFAGDSDAGTFALAQWLAERLFCQHLNDPKEPCGQCSACRRVQDGNEPDFQVIQSEKRTIGIDQVRALKEELTKSSMTGKRRLFVIKDADKMTIPAANSLLKFLEEPVSQVVIILTTTRPQQLLPTIRSRVQTLVLQAQDQADQLSQIKALGFDTQTSQLLTQSELTLAQLKGLAEPVDFTELSAIYWQWFRQILQGQDLAFPRVQARVLPAFKSQPLPEILQTLLIVSFGDLFRVKNLSQASLFWTDKKPEYQNLAESVSSTQTAAFVAAVLQVKPRLDANVSFQNVLEQLVLQLLAVKEGNFK